MAMLCRLSSGRGACNSRAVSPPFSLFYLVEFYALVTYLERAWQPSMWSPFAWPRGLLKLLRSARSLARVGCRVPLFGHHCILLS